MERLGVTFRGETRWHDHDVVWYALDRSEESTQPRRQAIWIVPTGHTTGVPRPWRS